MNTDHSDSPLFRPTRLGALALANRVVMAPLTRSRALAGDIPRASAPLYYAQRASAGLIISEATQISDTAKGYAWTPGCYTEAQVKAWREVTDAVHAKGGTIVVQLWHVGRISHPSLQPGGVQPLAPSAVTPHGQAFTDTGFQPHGEPRALEREEIPGIVADFAHAATMARRAGFDGVELHGANGYLIDQFLRDGSNKRTDDYGGSIGNRSRFLFEVVGAVSEAIGADRLGIRLSPVSPVNDNSDSNPMPLFRHVVEGLNPYGLAYLHMVEGATGGPRDIVPDFDFGELRRAFAGAYMANNGYTFAMADAALRACDADVIAFGRPFIANPDLVQKLRIGAPLATAEPATFYGGDDQGYIDHPVLTRSNSHLELRSRINADATLELWLEDVLTSEPGPDDVVVRIDAAPLNPSDVILLLGPADPLDVRVGGTPARPTAAARFSPGRLAGLGARLDKAMGVGNEGAGVVVAAGSNVRDLLGRAVALRSPQGTYAQHRTVPAATCLLLPEGTTPREGASAFINPLTALGMVETMRREGHRALIHTAAASNLGQMLNRVCLADGVPLINIVRSQAQVDLLRRSGATHVLDSTSEDFYRELVDAVVATGATLAFDAIGGGVMAGTLLRAMEEALASQMQEYSRYGSPTPRQVYVYGVLDPSPRVLEGNLGTAWSIGGWLMTWFYDTLDEATVVRLKRRVVTELTTTFASQYTSEITLADLLSPDVMRAYRRQATGEKFLVLPNG